MSALDFKAIASAALPHALELLNRWLPDGELAGKEYTVRNPTRYDRSPGSFRVNTETGAFADFATSEKGGDLIALAAMLHDISQTEAATYLAAAIGLESPVWSLKTLAGPVSILWPVVGVGVAV